MDAIQKQTQFFRSLPLGYYHLCSDGWQKGKLFHTDEQYAFGVYGLALSTLIHGVKIYAYELMPNHFHILLCATGEQCLSLFFYVIRRINKKLKEAGFPCLPDDYWFKLVPIKNKEQMKDLIVYLARNKFEKGACTPFGHKWGTGCLPYNQLAEFITGTQVRDMSQRELEQLVGSRTSLPADWEIHPVLGILPKNFVCIDKVLQLFPTVKEYTTRMVKQYESAVIIADSVGESVEWSAEEAKEILMNLCDRLFPGKRLYDLTADEKGRLAVQADSLYHLPTRTLSKLLQLSEYLIRQLLHSKDYGIKRIK